MIKREELTGIILSGGKSSRMGHDKGLCRFNGKALVEYALETLKPICGKILISANRNLTEYSRYGVPVLADEIKDIGPIGGIYTCLNHSETQHNLILSCDTPFVGTLLLKHLLSRVQKEQIVVPSHHKFLVEPLSAYYATNTLGAVKEAIDDHDYKLLNLFKRVRFKSVQVDGIYTFYNENSFMNINCEEDLLKAQQVMNHGKTN
jgi:molybdopterin-guanine dinucleotide biosynthesis protein A